MIQFGRRRVLWTVGAVLATLAGFVFVPTSAHARMAFTAPWSITMVSESGAWVGAGLEQSFDDANATLYLDEGNWAVDLEASGGTYGQSFSFTFVAGGGAVIGPGWYPDAQRAGFQASGRPGLDISGEGRGCNEIAGNFEVRDIAWSATGTLKRLWLLHEQHCEGGIRALFGDVRMGMTVVAADLEPDAVRWPEIHPGAQGETVPVLLRQIGTSIVGVSQVTLGGAHPQDFSIRSDGCTGRDAR